MNSLDNIASFIKKQKTANLASIDKNGFPNQKAMLKPRKIEGEKEFYFSTNTSSMRVAQYRDNPKASIYFFHKGLIKYEGVMLIGNMEVLEEAAIKEELWQIGDKIFYPKGVTDPDYCVLKFTAISGRFYSYYGSENFII